jgi:hypothetical protein
MRKFPSSEENPKAKEEEIAEQNAQITSLGSYESGAAVKPGLSALGIGVSVIFGIIVTLLMLFYTTPYTQNIPTFVSISFFFDSLLGRNFGYLNIYAIIQRVWIILSAIFAIYSLTQIRKSKYSYNIFLYLFALFMASLLTIAFYFVLFGHYIPII